MAAPRLICIIACVCVIAEDAVGRRSKIMRKKKKKVSQVEAKKFRIANRIFFVDSCFLKEQY